MIEREKLLRRVALKCRDVVLQLSYHRAINKQRSPLNFNLNFWICTYNNTIDMAVLDWGHLFGNEKDDLHWKNVANDVDKFRTELLSEIELPLEKWVTYWEEVKNYRDKSVAHIEMRPSSNIPEMTIALKATCFYYSHCFYEIKKLGDYSQWPEDLFDYYQRSLDQSVEIIFKALEATNNLRESVF